jgi:hypothetical protein
MTLLTAAGGDFYTALTGGEGGLVQVSMTFALAILLTVNMLFERREFLDMVAEIEESHSALKREFSTALVGIKTFSAHIRDAERLEADNVRHSAADIHRDAVRLEHVIEGILEDEEDSELETGGTESPAVVVASAR